jgi:hypothetical protein
MNPEYVPGVDQAANINVCCAAGRLAWSTDAAAAGVPWKPIVQQLR